MRFTVILFLAQLQASVLTAQHWQYRFSHIDINQGLSDNEAKCFLKDSKGFIWIGTLSGLNRFDGNNIKVFRNDPRDTSSLADNDILRIFEDPHGRIWINSYAGLNIYDPEKETFSRNPNHYLRQYGIPEGIIRNILKDSQGNFWFIHSALGLFRYGKDQKVLHIPQQDNDSTAIRTSSVFAIGEGKSGNLWIIHQDGVLEKFDTKELKVVYRNYSIGKFEGAEAPEYNMMVDSDGDMWINYINNNTGLFFFDANKNELFRLDKLSSKVRLNSNIIRGVVQDNRGLIWVATDHGGINLIDKKDFSVRYILSNPDDDKSLSQNSIQTIYKDRDDFIWIGTRGVSYYHQNAIRFQLFRNQISNPASLPFSNINCFAEDDKGNLWIGTNGGGLIFYDRINENFVPYRHDPLNNYSLSSNVIISLCFDRQKQLWIGTYYGGLNRFDGNRFIRYRHDPSNPNTISDDNIWEILEDSENQLWIGTLSSGADMLDRHKDIFSHFRIGDQNSIHSTYIPVIAEDQEGNIWFGSGYGMDMYDKQSGHFIHYLNDPKNPTSLGHNKVFSILDDQHGYLWIGTKEGLNLFDKKTKIFKVLRKEDGLPHNTVLTLLQDDQGNLWMSTPGGLSNIIVKRNRDGTLQSFQFKNYDEADGLQGKEFKEGAAYKTRKGELIFGGVNGFNIFRPDAIALNTDKPEVILTGFQVFNREVGVGEEINGKVILKKSITRTKSVTLEYNSNIFSIDFAALTFFHPEKVRYQYKLEGFNKNWLSADGGSRRATFTNLDQGSYIFRVKAANSDGLWNEDDTTLNITILPPFWKTWPAIALYIMFIFSALLLTRRLIQQRERMKFTIEQERQEAQRTHELDVMKIKFFTNVSHEFRTPLTLILTPLEKIIRNTEDTDKKNQFQLIQRNARRLLNLVNQLLDFRKLEVQEIKLNPSQGDIVAFISETVSSFSDLSEKKDIKLSFKTSINLLETIFDPDKIEKILFNLLSNAFKFTPVHGAVTVELSRVEQEGEYQLEIKVCDTGIGIPSDKLEKIFERFFQNDMPMSMVNQGSGIGLSITREFVRIHGGQISVTSEIGKGSCFTVWLPVADVPVKTQQSSEAFVPAMANHNEESPGAKIPTLLLVEDNEDFRFYLKDNLGLHYKIIEAKNGKEGWSQVTSALPDLIVSDIMMPEMNGIELCKKIKGDSRVSHIPVILLTARTAEEQRLEGFETGADDYITKPFNFEILLSRIKNLIHQRELFHKDFRRLIEIKARDINITSLDEKLIQKAIECVETNIDNPDFSVEEFSHELGMSRVHLYKKLLSTTGKAPLEFIRTIRLQRAAQLLEKSQLTVAEIAYKVGFNNPKYFTKYFKEEYHVLPSAYAIQKRQKDVN